MIEPGPNALEPSADALPRSRPEFLVTLGVLWPCTQDDVKQAYLAKVQQAHPDRGGDAAQFDALTKAFEQATEYARFHAGRTAWLGRSIEQYLERRTLVETIEAWGGQVATEPIGWLAREIGEDFAQVLDPISEIRLNRPTIDDRCVGRLAEHAALLTQLHVLDLSDSAVTDAVVPALAAFQSLRWLLVNRTQLSNRAIDQAAQLPSLEVLSVFGTRLRRFGRWRLRRRHPGINILSV